MSKTWKPVLRAMDPRALSLTPAEGFLLSRIDGRTSVGELALLTAQSEAQVATALERLIAQGAVLPSLELPAQTSEAQTSEAQTSEGTDDEQEAPLDDTGHDAAEDAEAAEAAAHAPTHLALYRERFHGLPPGERVQLASTATGAMLAALCFDPLPSVVRAILENPNASLAHARLIATHHRNAAGLEHLLAHGEWMRDAQVQRLLWRNPQLNEGQLRRLTASKRLLALWKLAVSREATAQTRAATAKLVRARFAVASAEERVELILSTEGRALAGLSGLPVDGRTTSVLCAKSYASLLLVQNLAKWSVAPGPLIAHLLRQPLVARAPQLRALLLRHPNAPNKSG